jgi:hypothetical protein
LAGESAGESACLSVHVSAGGSGNVLGKVWGHGSERASGSG